MDIFDNILLTFIPLFVTVDAVGTLPIFASLTEGLDKKEIRKILVQSIWTALALAFGFMLLGKAIFKVLGITMGDFMVAGGLILFVLAIIDLMSPGKVRRAPTDDRELGAVPIGTPLIVGPAVLTTSLLLIDQYGVFPTAVSVFANVILAGLVFSFSDLLLKLLGPGGSRALSKVMALFLAAIAVMMVRKGIVFLAGM